MIKTLMIRVLGRLKAFQELIALLIFYFGWLLNPLRPDLLVTYSESPFFVRPQPAEGPAPSNVQLITIVLKSNRSSVISNIELQVNDIKQVLETGARASYKRFDATAATKLSPQKDTTTYFFENIKELPAGHNIQLQLIADTYELMLTPRIKITSDAADTRIRRTAEVSGILVFLEEEAEPVGGALLVVTLVIGARRLVKGLKS